MKNTLILGLFLLLIALPAMTAQNCEVDVAAYLPGAMKAITEDKKDNKCIVVNFCKGTTYKAVQESIVDCGSINIFASGYPVIGKVDKGKLLVNDLKPEQVIIMGTNQNVFEPYEDMVVVAKNKDKIYVGGRDAAVKGDPYAVSRLMFMWQTYAYGIPGVILLYFFVKWIIKLRKKLQKSDDQWEDDFDNI